jgi:hypothetical protein
MNEFPEIFDFNIRSRLERALSQRLYLIDAVKNSETDWKFMVEGSTGNIYDVCVSDHLDCTCPDFVRRKLICKHIYFIIARVLKSSYIINDIGSEPNICIFSLKISIQNNFKELNPRFKIETKGKFSDLIQKPDDVCPICYENYQDSDITVKCKTCNSFFHNNCMNTWLKKASRCNCPMCRSTW